jgi:hypothetical protein
MQDNRIVKVTSPMDVAVTHGHLCIKGRFGFEFVHGGDMGALPGRVGPRIARISRINPTRVLRFVGQPCDPWFEIGSDPPRPGSTTDGTDLTD